MGFRDVVGIKFNYHQSQGVLTEIHNYWQIQLLIGNRIMSTFDQKWKELGMNMKVIRKAPEEMASNCQHNIISILSILLTTVMKIIFLSINLVGIPQVLGAVFVFMYVFAWGT